MAKISVIGSGGWGCALAVMAAKHGHEVSVWSVFPQEIEQLQKNREHRKLLPGVIFPDNMKLTTQLDCIKDSDIIIMTVPSFAVRSTAKDMCQYISDGQIVVNAAKGFEQDTLLRLSQVISQEIPQAKVAVLSGPSHAEEVSRGVPTTVVVACTDVTVATTVQVELMNPTFRIYVNTDVVGVEIGGALKNIIALAAGIVDGMNFGDNSKAALMTRGLSEFARLGCAMGARNETFAGLTGVGDLIVTCCSVHSRNHRAGVLIGEGISPQEAVERIGMVEGYNAAKAAYNMAVCNNIDMPIITEVYKVLYEGKDVRAATNDLMKRPKRHEYEDIWF